MKELNIACPHMEATRKIRDKVNEIVRWVNNQEDRTTIRKPNPDIEPPVFDIVTEDLA